MLAICGLFLYITYVYTHWIATNFAENTYGYFHRCGQYGVKLSGGQEVEASSHKIQNTVDDKSQMTWYGQIIAMKNFQIFGPYYLWKLYTTELGVYRPNYNLFEVYLCSCQLISTSTCFLLTAHSANL